MEYQSGVSLFLITIQICQVVNTGRADHLDVFTIFFCFLFAPFALCSFVRNYIATTGPERISSLNTIILAGGFENDEDVKVVSTSFVDNLTNLYSDQEEADTRLVLHSIHLAESHSRVVIRCDDTDVLVLLVYYSSKGMFGTSTVFMHSGHGPRQRFVPVCAIAKKLGAALCACLPACHDPHRL